MWISTNGFMKRVALGGMLSLSEFPETVLFFALLKLVFCEMKPWRIYFNFSKMVGLQTMLTPPLVKRIAGNVPLFFDCF
jgi:hypothetical protein